MTTEEFLEKMGRLPSNYEMVAVLEDGVARKITNIQVSPKRQLVWLVGGEVVLQNQPS